MATSGTISTTSFDTLKLIDDAFRIARVPPQGVTSEMQDTARDALYLLLSATSNRGIPLWAIDKQVLGFTQGQMSIDTPSGTIDVLNVNLRTLAMQTGSSGTRLSGLTLDFGADTTVTITTVGFTPSVSATLSLIFETSDDAVSWTQVGTVASSAYTAATKYWLDVSAPLTGRYFCIRDASATDITGATLVAGGTPTEVPFGRLNKDDYTALPNKSFQGRPLQFWCDRQIAGPRLFMWPTPDETAVTTGQLVIWRHRHIMDVGTLAQSIEVPQRWLEAVTLQLAVRLIMREPKADMNVLPVVKQMADEALMLAWMEETDRSPFRMMKNFSAYTA